MQLIRAPWWVLSLVTAVIVAVAEVIVIVPADGLSFATAQLVVVVAAVVGLFLGPLSARVNAQYVAALAPLPRNQETQARRAAMRGPVPEDAKVRAAAARVVRVRLARLTRQRVWLPLTLSASLVFAVPALLSPSPGLGLAVAFFVALSAQLTVSVRILTRRLTLLEPDER